MQVIELRAEHFKRLEAVRIRLKDSLTQIVGKNGAGKTSVLDAIAAALGGGNELPEMPIKKGKNRAQVVLELDEITVIRKWTHKGSSLEVIAKDGSKLTSPQAVLDKLVGSLSFDPLEFGRMKSAEQTATLARICKLDLDKFATDRKKVYDERAMKNRELKLLEGQLSAMPISAPEVPEQEQKIDLLMDQLKDAEEIDRKIDKVGGEYEHAKNRVEQWNESVAKCREQLEQAEKGLRNAEEQLAIKHKAVAELPDSRDTDAIHEQIKAVENTNRAVRAKQQRKSKKSELEAVEKVRNDLTEKLERMDESHQESIGRAEMPITGLSLSEVGVTFCGIPFKQCSAAEQLRVSVSIGLALNPALKLMLIRDGSLLDDDGMKLIAEIAEKQEAQVLIERVQTGKEIGVLIVDGEADTEAVALEKEQVAEVSAN